MIKGSNVHVMPFDGGWCVIDASNQHVRQCFESEDQAMAYAASLAAPRECGILVHAGYQQGALPSVSLPQRQLAPGRDESFPLQN